MNRKSFFMLLIISLTLNKIASQDESRTNDLNVIRNLVVVRITNQQAQDEKLSPYDSLARKCRGYRYGGKLAVKVSSSQSTGMEKTIFGFQQEKTIEKSDAIDNKKRQAYLEVASQIVAEKNSSEDRKGKELNAEEIKAIVRSTFRGSNLFEPGYNQNSFLVRAGMTQDEAQKFIDAIIEETYIEIADPNVC